MSEVKKILLFQTAFAGDVILFTSLIQAARGAFPDSSIHVLVIPQTADLLTNNPFCDRIIIYDKRKSEKGPLAFFTMVRRLRKENYDLALVPHRSLRSSLLVWAARVPRRIGFDRSAGKVFFTDVVPYRTGIHEVERNIKLLNAAAASIQQAPRPSLYPGNKERVEVDRFLDDASFPAGKPLLVLAPGSEWETKRWPLASFIRLTGLLQEEIGAAIAIIGGIEDEPLAAEIVKKSGGPAASAAGRLSFLASAELIRRAGVVVANDSSPLHLAVAVGTPVVALFGPTIPEFGFRPRGPKDVVLQKDMYCRPCGIHGGRRCREGHLRCLNDISPEEVFRAVKQVVGT